MVRLRALSSEIYSPADIKPGLILNMPYLLDFAAYQEYMDGKLDKLYSRMAGNDDQQNVTGARFYKNAGPGSYWEINLFRSVVRHVVASVFERNPTVLDATPEEQELWEERAGPLIKAARAAVEWRVAKGHGVLTLENRNADNMVLRAVDPRGYIPIVDRVDRDLVIGTFLFRLWYDGPRSGGAVDHPNRITTYVHVSEEQAALQFGMAGQEINEVKTFWYGGSQGSGVASGLTEGKFGEQEGETRDNAILNNIWVFGDGDSVFGTMERNVYEIILLYTHSRTAMTRDVRAVRIDPASVNPSNTNEDGDIVLDPLDPTYRVSVSSGGSGTNSSLGYVDPPGPALSAAFRDLAQDGITNLAFTANMPPEVFGDNYMAGEPAEAVTKLQQIFKTWVLDMRDDLGKILSEAYEGMYGTAIKIGWELELFANSKEQDERYIMLYKEKLVTQEYAQEKLKIPKVKIEEEKDDDSKVSDGETDSQDSDIE